MSGKKRFQRRFRGATLVEFALVSPLLLTLIFGIIQLGFLLNSYASITNLVREASRVGAVTYTASDADRVNRMVLVVETHYDRSWPESAGMAFFMGRLATPSPVSVTYAPADATNPSRSGQPMTVTLSYDYQFRLPFVDQVQPFRLDTRSTVRIE